MNIVKKIFCSIIVKKPTIAISELREKLSEHMKVVERRNIVKPCSLVVFNFNLSDTITLQECSKFESDIDDPILKTEVLRSDLGRAFG